MEYGYNIEVTTSPLSENELYAGKVVCLQGIATNPNKTGILQRAKRYGLNGIRWEAVINGVNREFNAIGAELSNPNTPILYGVLSIEDLNPTTDTTITRTVGVEGKSNSVSLLNMTPKDYFACHALTALIQRVDNPLAMDDGTIALVAAKSYKIAQAMAIEAYGSRENDNASSASGTEVVVDKNGLQTNTERILYNINESIKANTKSNKELGVKISNIDKVKFDGTPTVKLDATSEVKINGTPSVNVSNTPNVNVSNAPSVNINGTPNVYVTNMPSASTEPVSSTDSVDNSQNQ